MRRQKLTDILLFPGYDGWDAIALYEHPIRIGAGLTLDGGHGRAAAAKAIIAHFTAPSIDDPDWETWAPDLEAVELLREALEVLWAFMGETRTHHGIATDVGTIHVAFRIPAEVIARCLAHHPVTLRGVS